MSTVRMFGEVNAIVIRDGGKVITLNAVKMVEGWWKWYGGVMQGEEVIALVDQPRGIVFHSAEGALEHALDYVRGN